MTPTDLAAAIQVLTGDVSGIAGELGYGRHSIYRMLSGKMPIKPDTEAQVIALLRQRHREIGELLRGRGVQGI